MKKILTIIGVLFISTLLIACTEEAPTIQDPIFGRIEVNERYPLNDQGELEPYNVNRNEDIRVEVFLANPDNLQINAVSINGVSYRSHRFASGSTNEHIIIDFSSGNTIGPLTYTVESIEYSSRGLLETMQISQRNTYQINVLRNVPSIRFERVTPSVDSLEVSVPITDSDEVLTRVLLQLELDGTLVEEVNLEAGQNTHEFEDLLSGKNYSVRVEWAYNLMDGTGSKTGYIATEVTTPSKSAPTVELVEENLLTTRYQFDLLYTDPSGVLTEDTLTIQLLTGDDIIETQSVALDALETIEFGSLFANTDYTVMVWATYGLNDGEGEQTKTLLSFDFATLERTLPEINVNYTSTKTSLNVTLSDLALEDMMDDGTLRLRLLNEDGDIVGKLDYIEEANSYTFFDLWSGYDYTLELIGDVNFGDGEGYVETILHEEILTTTSLAIPSVSISNVSYDEVANTFSFNTPITDSDNTLTEVRLEVYRIPYEIVLGEDEVFDLWDYAIESVTIIDEDTEEEITLGENILTASEGEPRTAHTYDLLESTETEYLIRVSMSYNLRDNKEDIEHVLMDVKSFFIQTIPQIEEPVE